MRLLLTALVVLASAGCSRTEDHGAPQHPPATPKRRVVPLVVPSDAQIPAGAQGDLIRRGRTLAMRTKEELGDRIGADMHCSSCHLMGGTVAGAGPWIGLSGAYPLYRARAGRDTTLEDRVDECVERSLNGKPLAHDAPEMKAIVAYIDWLSKDVPKDADVEGRGFTRLERPVNVDPDVGQTTYTVRCASCHGLDGQGKKNPEGGYLYPPLWGDRSFNIGAGMARLDTAAAFVYANMPFGAGKTLTVSEAYDATAYFTRQARPDYAGKAGDWPKGGKPPDARY